MSCVIGALGAPDDPYWKNKHKQEGNKMSDFVNALRGIVGQELLQSIEKLIDEKQQLTEERDEARREVCDWSAGVGIKATSQAVAEERGWDCYKEETQ